uniref:Uncharacterized protein n=1 Tax=Amphimedon queenslandica TaxID=400682 RepID=A0A1X7V9H4_AMPQE
MALALSAAMSKSTWRDVSRILGMSKPVTIAKSPDKPNLVYSLIEKSEMEEVFHSVIEELKAKRLQMESRMGVVIATVAFRLGTDCPNVCKETGWAGQDGQLSFATLCYNGQDISFAFMEKEIVEYCKNTETCRQQLLFCNFEANKDEPDGCACCDLCALHCECIHCSFD